MQATESYIGSEQPLDVRLLEKDTQEMQDTLSRYLPSFYRRAYDTWVTLLMLRMRSRTHSCPLVGIWTNSRARRKCLPG
jgi:hypothetical protein